ncbi:hypothetical protein [Paenibacillus flagellatus]|uniref:Uncharacterized protein n=1 Tax=Paenibacillus flagellatus TaxID=2211139 RepID=A0A2V5K578_9BACL|nr:hypothetical protein [Paenibacillus flagellatus]PYI54525.1 hypothetical protein DLM86_13770 [Paenibacillus flagellatus]
MNRAKKWAGFAAIAVIAVVIALYGQKDRTSVVEAKPYVPQPLIVLDGGTITYNDAPDCH